VPSPLPLSTLLSQALVALTIELDNEFERRFADAGGGARVTSLTMCILDDPALRTGITPYPDGWRASKAYLRQTEAQIADPRGRLPHHPMVLHRGGWPDGS